LVNTSFPVLMFEPRSYLQVRPHAKQRVQLPAVAATRALAACLCAYV
jgi:hypothetical protein